VWLKIVARASGCVADGMPRAAQRGAESVNRLVKKKGLIGNYGLHFLTAGGL
jgi:hypothetical protein